MRQIAVFVDAGYFWVQAVQVIHGCKKQRESVEIDYEALRRELCTVASHQSPSHDFLRIYWYDGPGTNGKTGSHATIENLDDFKLRLGTRNAVGSQKAVDGLIIADMISLAQSRSITRALLVSGDADLAPGVVAAQGLGVRVHLLSMGSAAATSHVLKVEVDTKIHWDDVIVRKFATASKASPVPIQVPNASPITATIAPAVAPGVATEIAQEVQAKLSPDQVSQISEKGPLPQDVDRLLLRAARSKLQKRMLDEDERRLIRAQFKKQIALGS